MQTKKLLAAATLTALATWMAPPAFAKDEALAKAIASPQRSAEFVARDKIRKPQEELEFFGIKPGMTVVEIAPGGGYWTEILAPYLRDKGTFYTAITARAASDRAAQAYDKWKQKLDDNKASYGAVKISDLGRDVFNVAPEGSADLVLTFRNVHNWMGAGVADQAFASFFKALKPGGVLGVEEHRGSNDKPQDPKAANGYVREDYTIALAEKAGFKLLGKSEMLANPKDTKDYPKGVWTLPPTLTLGETDRAKYEAIGEADNFVLKFEKPKK
jgi:predicted methyltransferase